MSIGTPLCSTKIKNPVLNLQLLTVVNLSFKQLAELKHTSFNSEINQDLNNMIQLTLCEKIWFNFLETMNQQNDIYCQNKIISNWKTAPISCGKFQLHYVCKQSLDSPVIHKTRLPGAAQVNHSYSRRAPRRLPAIGRFLSVN